MVRFLDRFRQASGFAESLLAGGLGLRAGVGRDDHDQLFALLRVPRVRLRTANTPNPRQCRSGPM